MASSASGLEDKARELLEKTEIIASVQHPLEFLAEPFIGEGEDKPFGYMSALELLQKQLLREAELGWQLSCIPRVYGAIKKEENGDESMTNTETSAKPKHAFPLLDVPPVVHPGTKPLFPETYFSMYADHEIETVPRTADIAASILRDAIVDTINILDFSRLSLAKFLIDFDCYFAPGTFVKRATPFDKVLQVADGKSSWKPEDLVVDAIFSQMLFLPTPEHKLVYYHSVVTEACKVAPAAIAPTLGRGIRFLYRNLEFMDMELMYRFLDWFSHHVSNFDFRWKWTEWTEDVDNSIVDPRKAFIVGVIDKEIRLSFAKRIRETLPKDYHKLILEGKFKDTPDFKYNSERKCNSTPLSC
jgi:nuclear cap-binding protein subunit 1